MLGVALILLFLAVPLFGQNYCGLDVSTVPTSTNTGTVLTPTDYLSAGSWAPLAKGASRTEEFGGSTACQYERVTSGIADGIAQSGSTSPEYSTQDPFNSDDSLLWIHMAIVRRSDGRIVVPPSNMPPTTGGKNLGAWSRETTGDGPATFIYGFGSQVMKSKIGTAADTNCDAPHDWSGAPCHVQTTPLCTAGYNNIQFNQNDISWDGLHAWLMDAWSDSGSPVHIQLFEFDAKVPTTCTLKATVTYSGTVHKLGTLPNNYLFAQGSNGDFIYKDDGSPYLTVNSQSGHADFGYDAAEDNKLVGISVWWQDSVQNACPYSGWYGGVGLLMLDHTDPRFGTVYRCLSLGCVDSYQCSHQRSSHYSWRNPNGWILSEMIGNGGGCPSSIECINSNPPSPWYTRTEEIVAWRLKPGGDEVRRLVHHRSRAGGTGGGYWGQPRPIISHDNKYIAFSSNYNQTGTSIDGAVDTYIIRFELSAGGTPNASLTPNLLAFGSQVVGSPSASQATTLSNGAGTAALSITSIATTGDFAKTSDNCGSSLAAGSTCTVNLTFTPTTTGARTGTLTVTDNSNNVPGSRQTINLTGTGTTHVLTLTPKLSKLGL